MCPICHKEISSVIDKGDTDHPATQIYYCPHCLRIWNSEGKCLIIHRKQQDLPKEFIKDKS